MILTRLSLQSFRNLETMALEFGSGFNIFYGDNAQGKTNLLESIFLLGTLKSFRMARNSELITWERQFSLIKGSVRDELSVRDLSLLLDKGFKKAKVDQKAVTKVADFFGIITVVLFAPDELAMVRGTPETRRRYLDRAIFAGDMAYLARHHEYMRILKQRNSLLKSGDISSLMPWNEQLIQSAAQLVYTRLSYTRRINVMLHACYRQITGTTDDAAIQYHAAYSADSDSITEIAERLATAIDKIREQECHQRTTLVGPHRDDLIFTINGRPVKQAASQGQLRCFVLALKMAEIEYLHQSSGRTPVLLLDDMTSELDRLRTRNLMDFISNKGMQVFVTTTALEQAEALARSENLCTFHVKQGTVQRNS